MMASLSMTQLPVKWQTFNCNHIAFFIVMLELELEFSWAGYVLNVLLKILLGCNWLHDRRDYIVNNLPEPFLTVFVVCRLLAGHRLSPQSNSGQAHQRCLVGHRLLSGRLQSLLHPLRRCLPKVSDCFRHLVRNCSFVTVDCRCNLHLKEQL